MASARRQAQDAIKHDLGGPASVTFRTVRAMEAASVRHGPFAERIDGPVSIVCGQYNARGPTGHDGAYAWFFVAIKQRRVLWTADDVSAMRSAMVTMRASTDATQFFEAVLAFHGVVAAAAHIPVLEGMHQLVVTSIKAVLSRVRFVHDHEPLLARSLDVHDDIVAAIALHDQASFVDAINRHDQDLIRGDDPDRTPITPQRP